MERTVSKAQVDLAALGLIVLPIGASEYFKRTENIAGVKVGNLVGFPRSFS